MRLRLALTLLLVAGLIACAGVRVRSDLVYHHSYDSYRAIADNWTRSGKIYHNFATRAIVAALYLSRPMRQVFVAEWARAYDLPAAERDRLLAEHLERAAQSVEFVVSFYTPRERYNDLDEPESSWRLWLIDAAGAKVEAVKVEKIRVRHKKEFYFYPEYNEWNRLYRVLFPARDDAGRPLVTETGTVTLRVTGVEGMADLAWEIPPGNQ